MDWKTYAQPIKDEAEKLGFSGRFGAGLPRVSDGSLLFLQHMLSHMKPVTEAGSGESEIRRWILENDWLEGIVALGPTPELLGRDETGRLRLHVAMVAVFLVVAHVAMTFGMLDPAVMGYSPKAPASVQHDMGSMSGMNHDMGGMMDMDHSTMMPSSAPSK